MGDLRTILGDLAIKLEDQSDAESTLQEIVHSSIDIVPGARWGGISLVEGKRIEPRVPTDQLVAELDKLQTELDQGPCLSALRDQHTVKVDDMTTEDRWPRFALAATDRGVFSSLSFRLFVVGGSLGALNLYGSDANAFDEESVSIGEVVAQHASVALSAVAAEAQFGRALDSRDIIGQAKGLLMQRNNVTGLHAFRMLTKVSQDTNTKIVEIARLLVENHEAGAEPLQQ